MALDQNTANSRMNVFCSFSSTAAPSHCSPFLSAFKNSFSGFRDITQWVEGDKPKFDP